MIKAQAAIGVVPDAPPVPPPPPLPYGLKQLPPLPNLPPLPAPSLGQSIFLNNQQAEEILQSLHYVGIPAKKEDLLADHPDFKPNLLFQIQKQQHEGVDTDEMYGNSNLFRNDWRARKQTRYGQKEGDGFADNLDDDDPLTRRRQRSIIAPDGLFGNNDVAGDEEKDASALPGGLFDDSDEERELKEQMKQNKQNTANEPENKQGGGGLFDIEEEEDNDDFAKKQKEELEKKANKFLAESEDEDEFKPVQRTQSINPRQKSEAKPEPPKKKNMFGDSDEEDEAPAQTRKQTQ